MDYAERWAEGNAGLDAAGDPLLRQLLIRNYLPRGIDQARQLLRRSRAR